MTFRPRLHVIAAVIGCLSSAAAAQSTERLVGEAREVIVARGETLRTIGSRHGVDPASMARDNGIAPTARLVIGQRLVVDGRHLVPEQLAPGTIVVNVPQRMLFFATDTSVSAFPVAVGRRSWPTPLGPFAVVTREEHPTWDVPASIMEEARRAGHVLPPSVPPGPDNPLGDYWLGLSVGGVGIHGTNAPSSIYQAVTHGCIRVHPDDIAQLFTKVPVGTRGVLVYEPVLVARLGDTVLLEVHPDVYRRGPADIEAYVRAKTSGWEGLEAIDWARVRAIVAERAGIPRVVSFPSGERDRRD
jgi:L,D-transpeptidase ErfK/SrfK